MIHDTEINSRLERLSLRIKKARRDLELSRDELADRSDLISKNALERWERGAHLPGAKQIVALARVLEVSSDYLLGLDRDPV